MANPIQGYFNSTSYTLDVNGFPIWNRAVGSEFMAKFAHTVLGNGAAAVTTGGFQVVKKTGMTVTVKPYFICKDGYMMYQTGETDITFTSSTSEQVFYIGARLDVANNHFTGDNVAAYTTFVSATDLASCKITITANAVTITDGMIEDLRYNTTYCGAIDQGRQSLQLLHDEYLDKINALDLETATGIGAVSYSTAQTLTSGEKAQARTNIAATESLREDVTIYVSKTGSDTTGDGSSSSPYATVNYAVSKIPRVLSGYDCIISIAAGTYAEHVIIKGFLSGRIALSLGGAVTFNSLTVSGFGTYVTCGSSAMLTCGWISIQAGALFDRFTGQITLTGETTISGVKASLHCSLASVCNASSTVTVNNSTGTAIGAYQFGRISIGVLAGTGNTGNRISVYSGGICVYDATAATINVTTTYTTSGGKIYSGAQTSVPNY